MPTQNRRERERASRHELIVRTARELAETEGWDAVTTRRLSERIEYSQPVLYSHFAGKDAIIGAVAMQGFAELADALAAARAQAEGEQAAVAAVFRTYLAFAAANPALYDAMFTLSTDLPFAQATTPAPMQAGFAQLHGVLAPFAGEHDSGVFTELWWATMHGLATLARGGRIPADAQEQRVAMLVDQLTGPAR
ncbi:TetR/AcrR family transcriptional regulator [Pseudonocardia sp. CA-142604]|uniref:TetR/AcrR family transcriptional regulator n=1 Tax=Pseudonocardia sp. CA-142604 TaxID=3240024 RepID=UPI003D920035